MIIPPLLAVAALPLISKPIDNMVDHIMNSTYRKHYKEHYNGKQKPQHVDYEHDKADDD